MKRRLIPILRPESLLKMPTKQLLGRLRALHKCEESSALSDLTAGEIAGKGILFKNSVEWQVAYDQLKAILPTREHVPSAAERTMKRKERGRLRRDRKSNPTVKRLKGNR